MSELLKKHEENLNTENLSKRLEDGEDIYITKEYENGEKTKGLVRGYITLKNADPDRVKETIIFTPETRELQYIPTLTFTDTTYLIVDQPNGTTEIIRYTDDIKEVGKQHIANSNEINTDKQKRTFEINISQKIQKKLGINKVFPYKENNITNWVTGYIIDKYKYTTQYRTEYKKYTEEILNELQTLINTNPDKKQINWEPMALEAYKKGEHLTPYILTPEKVTSILIQNGEYTLKEKKAAEGEKISEAEFTVIDIKNAEIVKKEFKGPAILSLTDQYETEHVAKINPYEEDGKKTRIRTLESILKRMEDNTKAEFIKIVIFEYKEDTDPEDFEQDIKTTRKYVYEANKPIEETQKTEETMLRPA